MKYFHVAPNGLKKGYTIEPGSWGQQIRQFGQERPNIDKHSDAIILMWEVALESARIQISPDAPSRLSCVFACDSADDAKMFRDCYRVGWAIYEIEALSNPAVHAGCYDLISKTASGPYVDMMVDRTIPYWKSLGAGMRELLIGGPVSVVRRL